MERPTVASRSHPVPTVARFSAKYCKTRELTYANACNATLSCETTTNALVIYRYRYRSRNPQTPRQSYIPYRLEKAFFWFPSAHPFVSRGAKIACFILDVRFLTNFGRLPLRRCVSLRFHVFLAPARPHCHILRPHARPTTRTAFIMLAIGEL